MFAVMRTRLNEGACDTSRVPVAPERHTTRHWPALLAPIVLFLLIVALLAVGLGRDPRQIPSPLIGKPVPEFALPAVQGRMRGLASGDLRGEVSLVNVFASWCAACRDEHPLLMALATANELPIHGLNYKDRPEDAAAWLDALGDPYTRTGADLDGRVGIDWGVYGVPETFLIDAQGRIVFKQIGPITAEILTQKILPLVRSLAGSAADPRLVHHPGESD
jgi:cytochrome c biogenesis protein CcmG/thiol:disulfide interchange protein DsbE